MTGGKTILITIMAITMVRHLLRHPMAALAVMDIRHHHLAIEEDRSGRKLSHESYDGDSFTDSTRDANGRNLFSDY
ncbi:MAG: hypothetical protein HGB20_01340 [Chlorobiaceae bacterium]|nr:hypothetical protein [Chlorobiaceae bacterium]